MIDFQSVKEDDDSKESEEMNVALDITEKVMKRPLARHVGPLKRRKPLLSSSTSNKPLVSTITPESTQEPEIKAVEAIENQAPPNYLVNSDENPMKSPSIIYI